jgi:hypothetical protein
MTVDHRLRAILDDDRLNEESGFSKAEAVEALIGPYGWEPIREFFLDILRDDGQGKHWRTAADVFWGATWKTEKSPRIN